jgi:RNA polymerase sigma-70 factor (ECF subfamily)
MAQARDRCGDQTRLRAWLVTVAANEARQAMRRHRRLRRVEVRVDEIDDRAGPGIANERDLDLRAALARLSTEDRMIVSMRYALGLTSAEIGREMGLAPPSVRSRLSRAIAVLRTELGDD